MRPAARGLIAVDRRIRRWNRSHLIGVAAVVGTAFRARKLIPWVPNFAALEDWGAPANTAARQGISKPTKPAAVTVA